MRGSGKGCTLLLTKLDHRHKKEHARWTKRMAEQKLVQRMQRVQQQEALQQEQEEQQQREQAQVNRQRAQACAQQPGAARAAQPRAAQPAGTKRPQAAEAHAEIAAPGLARRAASGARHKPDNRRRVVATMSAATDDADKRMRPAQGTLHRRPPASRPAARPVQQVASAGAAAQAVQPLQANDALANAAPVNALPAHAAFAGKRKSSFQAPRGAKRNKENT